MRNFEKSKKLNNVCYDIRGPVMDEAKRMEAAGAKIMKLNIGNPAVFNFEAPPKLVEVMNQHLATAHAYTDSRGIVEAREAIVRYHRSRGIKNIDIDDVYIGNGVSELIMVVMQGLLDSGDEVLIPSPDYPLWTAAVNLAGGTAVHYRCDEQSDWNPDIEDIRRKISPRTKGILLINPNNPTGAVYSREVVQQVVDFAVENQLILFADEIYDRIIYDGAKHYSAAAMSDETLFITLNGLSKSHRVAGYRSGWMVISGNRAMAKSYLEGLNMLCSMRLCSNAPAQYAVKVALDEENSIEQLIAPGGRLHEQRDYAWKRLNEISGISCVKPQGALYLFPKIDAARFNIKNDEKFIRDLLVQTHVHLVQGTGFNWPEPNHFRIIFLPDMDVLVPAFDCLEEFLKNYRQAD